jgi:sugar phosphate isomerase/epimerase
MKTAVSTSLLWKSAPAPGVYFNDIAGAGFDYIELDAHNIFGRLTDKFAAALAASLKDAPRPLRVSSVHMPYTYPISSPSKSARGSAIKRFAKTIETLIGKLEPYSLRPLKLVFHPGVHCDKIPYDSQKQAIEAGIKETGALIGGDSRFEAAFENMLSSHFASSAADIIDIAAMAKTYISPGSGICFDSCHAAYDNLSHEFLEKIIDKVITVHLSDNYNQPHGEFHAVPMSVIHSKIDWRRIAGLLSGRLEILTLELSKPPVISYLTYLKMAKIAAAELESFAGTP